MVNTDRANPISLELEQTMTTTAGEKVVSCSEADASAGSSRWQGEVKKP